MKLTALLPAWQRNSRAQLTWKCLLPQGAAGEHLASDGLSQQRCKPAAGPSARPSTLRAAQPPRLEPAVMPGQPVRRKAACRRSRSLTGDPWLGLSAGKVAQAVCAPLLCCRALPSSCLRGASKPQSIPHQRPPNAGGGFCFSCHAAEMLSCRWRRWRVLRWLLCAHCLPLLGKALLTRVFLPRCFCC